LVDDHARVLLPPLATDVGDADNETVGAGVVPETETPKGKPGQGAIKKVNAISAKLRGWWTEIPCREFEYRSEIVSSQAVSGYFLPISDLRPAKNQLSPYSYWW